MPDTNFLTQIHGYNFSRTAFFGSFLSVLLVGWVIKQERKRIWYSLVHEKWKIFRQALYFLFFLAIIHFILKSIFPYKAECIKYGIAIFKNDKNSWYWLLLGGCILAPLAEECIFRYFIFKIFGRKNPLSYLFSFSTFIFYHYWWTGENMAVLFLQYCVASFGLIYIYKKSNWNLLSPILLHSLINLLFIGILFINPDCFLI